MNVGSIPPGADPSTTPLAANPNGDPPNFEGGPTLQPAFLATGVIFIPISAILIIIRLGVSAKHSKKLHPDDYLCALGEVIGIAYWITLYEFQVKPGTYKHTWDLPANIVTPQLMKAHVASQVLNMFAHAFVKASIPAFFIRLFGNLRWLRYTSYGLIVAVVIFSLAPFISMMITCTPGNSEAWDSVAFVAWCATASGPQTITLSSFDVLFDIIVVVIPIVITSRLKLDQDKKRGIIIIFLVSFLVVAASVTGLAYRIIVKVGSIDPYWNDGNITITSYMEIFGTVIVTCAPSLRLLWLTMSGKVKPYSEVRSRRHTSNRTKPIPVLQDPRGSQEVTFEYYPQNEHYENSGYSYDPTYTQGQPIPLSTIQKPVPIIQHASNDTLVLDIKYDGDKAYNPH